MITDIVEINNFVVLIEKSISNKTVIQACNLNDQIIGISFYVSGNVELTVDYNEKEKMILNNNTGHVSSFFGNKHVKFSHKISPKTPLKSISIFSTIDNLHKLPDSEHELFNTHLSDLLQSQNNFSLGPFFYMTPDIQTTVIKIFKNNYSGATRMMFLKSQVLELLTHFFANISSKSSISLADQEKLFKAKEIVSNSMDAPPSLSELSKMIGLNDYKLKKNFKELFGVPVFKYLQYERLNKAHSLIADNEMSIQQAALYVGYESLSSFSKAFLQKFGYRPSKLKM